MSADPHVAGRDAAIVHLTSRYDEVRAPLEDRGHAPGQLLKVQQVVVIGVAPACFGYILFHGILSFSVRIFVLDADQIGPSRQTVGVHHMREHVYELFVGQRYGRYADRETDLPLYLVLRVQVHVSGLFLLHPRQLLVLEPNGKGTCVLCPFEVEIHSCGGSFGNGDSPRRILQPASEAAVQKPLEVEDLRGHGRLDALFAGEFAKTIVERLQGPYEALHPEDESSPRQVVRDQTVRQVVRRQFVSHYLSITSLMDCRNVGSSASAPVPVDSRT
nr:MAG TPA: hypothetical protein [Caudoviricetes sp.]